MFKPRKAHLFILYVSLFIGLCYFIWIWAFLNENSINLYLPENEDNTKPLVLKRFLKSLPTNGCTEQTKLLVAVLSSPDEFEDRAWIRETWANQSELEMTSKRIFMIGQSQNSSLNKQVIKEAREYRDILILNFEEHYLNLTYKVYGMLEYVNKYCKNLKCVQKTDTDATVNVKGLEKLCNTLPENEHIITGMLWHELEVSRDTNGKHYIPLYVYPNEFYPDFATGTAYLLSGYHIAQRMLNSLRENTPFFTSENFRKVNEDALFTGIVRESAGIRMQDIGGYACCIKSHGNKMIPWCDNSTDFIKIPIAFENFGQSRQEDLDFLRSWMKNETC